jgi:uracil-DNA glycosylase family 4
MTRLARQVARCPLCPELVENRTAPVFGEGQLAAKVLLVGEAPGRQEDEQGQPFVGQAGKVLDALLAEAGLDRDDVYLTNIIRCRPPRNRTPLGYEITNCLPYLQQQIALLRPKVICALGGVAACALVGTDQPLERLRGRMHVYDGIRLICSYHPAYVRRMPAVRRRALADLRRVRNWLTQAAAQPATSSRQL